MGNFINLFIVFLLVFLNGFFVAAEFSIVKVRASRIKTLFGTGNKKALYAKKVLDDLNSYLSACQFGITLASLGLGWIGEPVVANILSPLFNYLAIDDVLKHTISFIIGFSLITAIHIVLGELVPKSIAILSSEKVALASSRPLIIFYKISYPVIWLFDKSTNFILKIFGIENVNSHEEVHSNDEIMLLLKENYKHGLLNKEELTLVDNVFELSEKNVMSVMIPRTDMHCINMGDDFKKIMEYVLDGKYTRYPVCLENKDNIVGFIHIRDLCKQAILNTKNSIEEMMREIIFVPNTMSVNALFKTFQEDHAQIAIVIDEYGGTAGLVTLEDIIEELVGEIQDEFDINDVSEIKKISDTVYSVDGKVTIDRINKLLSINIETKVETIGGLFSLEYGSLPEAGEKIIYEGYEFTIIKSDNKRVVRVRIEKI
jgi:CBS domain containing-hemolysin-like protein